MGSQRPQPVARRPARHLRRHHGHDVGIDLRFLFSRQLSLLGSYMGRKGELLRAAEFLFTGELMPVVDCVYPLAEAADAHRRLEAREGFGKIVLTT